MTFTEAAAFVLRLVGKPLHYKEITDVAIERSLLSHVGKSPEVTMGARLAAQVKKADRDNPLKRVKPGVFALSEWDEALIEKGLSDRTPALQMIAKSEASSEVSESQEDTPEEGEAAPSDASVAPLAAHQDLDDETAPPDEEEQHRAELSAMASDLFESEDDDDQPIFATPQSSKESADDDGGDDKQDGKRRRRRRRGRGRRDEETSSDELGDDLPTYTVSDAEPEDVLSAEDIAGELEEPEVENSSLVAMLETALGRYDRGKGPVAAQNVADSLKRKWKGDGSLNGASLVAAAAADNLAAERRQVPPRFLISGNRLGLVSWNQDKKQQERVRAAHKALAALNESVQKSLSDELKRLPQRATGEIVQVLLERAGVSDLHPVRRPGSHGAELHFSGKVTFGGAVKSKVAIVVRRDGKDIGRERVTELRGALHHYDGASLGWILSTGQILSGAKEEAHSKGASPVTLTGRTELAELCIAHGVGIRVQRIEVPVLDSELFDSLQGR